MKKSTLKITYRDPAALRPYDRNARTHSKKQLKQIARSIETYGFTNPVLVSATGEIIAGHGRVEAAKMLGMEQVPTIRLDHLSEAERRAYVLADNKLALNAGWDPDILALELQGLGDLGFDLELTGFSLAEIDLALDYDSAADPTPSDEPGEDEVPPPPPVAVTRRGDLWVLGRHRLLCGDAREPAHYDTLLGGESVDVVFTDPPYNCPIDGHVSGLGKVRHREFAMAAGELSDLQFAEFLATCLGNIAASCRDGAIAFVCMDWRGIGALLAAGKSAFTELKQLCVWNKGHGGMGTFYRSQHELVFAFKKGTAPHTNSFGLGDTGRYRTNVWDYPGVNSLGSAREEHERHPTPKPVALVADALRDCSRRGEIVLDAFGGAGSTLIAAESCGRAARLIEYDEHYCDTIVLRYQQFTGRKAVLAANGKPYEDVAEEGLAGPREAKS